MLSDREKFESLVFVHIWLPDGTIFPQQICGLLWSTNSDSKIWKYKRTRSAEMHRTNTSILEYVEIFRSRTVRVSLYVSFSMIINPEICWNFCTFSYIYTSLCQKASSVYRKVFASFFTFTFIYLWHGIYLFVFIWSIMNFVCLQLEQVGRYVGRVQQHNFEKYFGPMNQNRIKALFGTQIFIPAVISNFYFFAGVDVGNVFIERTYFTGNFVIYLSLSFCCYCIYHVSEVIERWEMERRRMKVLKIGWEKQLFQLKCFLFTSALSLPRFTAIRTWGIQNIFYFRGRPWTTST